MTKSKLTRFLLMLALVAGMCAFQPNLSAQQDQPAARQPDAASQPPAMKQSTDPQTFSGKIAKAGGKFVLKDEASKSTYALDDQDKAKQFEGQAVQVTGTLDAQTKTIRISSITPGS